MKRIFRIILMMVVLVGILAPGPKPGCLGCHLIEDD